MSIQAVAWALEQDMPARPKLVLVSIANHADHRTGYCWLKAETIGDEASCTARAVFNFVGDLIRNGYVRKAPRKGDDGKQRANDYWIIFDRAPAEWVSDRTQSVTDEDEPSSSEPDETEAGNAISSKPDAPGSCGENDTPAPVDPVDMSPGSSGPHAHAFNRQSLDEPSKTNPKKSGAHSFASAPRKYQAPPVAPEPQGHLQQDARLPIFVRIGTPAWDAWVKRGHKPTLFTVTYIDGERRTGWCFPTLYPAGGETEKESSEGSKATGPPIKKTA